MNISLASSRMNGFKKWSDNHPANGNDDDNPGGAAPIALVKPPAASIGLPHTPWAVPGVGGAF